MCFYIQNFYLVFKIPPSYGLNIFKEIRKPFTFVEEYKPSMFTNMWYA